MNTHEIAQECEDKISNGEIVSCSIKELHEYIVAMSDFSSARVSKHPDRAAHVQILNSLISIKTLETVNNTMEQSVKTLEKVNNAIEHTEDTINILNEKNAFLTKVVVLLASLSFIASCLQIYFTILPPTKATSYKSQEISLQKSESKSLQNLPSKAHASQ